MSIPENPITRRELYLARAAGQDVELPAEDITREEMYLRAIAEGGGGGSTSPFYPAGNIEFANLPELSTDILGAMYNVTDAFTTDSRFNEGAGVKYPAGTNVAVVNIGTEENPTLKFDTYTGAYTVDDELSDVSENPVQNKVITAALGNKADTSALNNYVEKEAGKSLSTNDYTDADKALVQDSPITVTATGAEITASTAQGKPNALTVYGKSEVVDGAIVSAGAGWATVDLGTLDWVYRDDLATKQFRASFSQAEWIQDYNVIQSIVCPIYKNVSYQDFVYNDECICRYYTSLNGLNVIDSTCTTLAQFLNKINGVILAYKEETPTNNTIAIKTDNGSGVNGTMAVFSTGTPLRGITGGARDVMAWDGVSGEVTKNCGEIDLGTLDWTYNTSTLAVPIFIAPITNSIPDVLGICPQYMFTTYSNLAGGDKRVCIVSNTIRIHDETYTDAETFKTAMSGVKLVYELATPTTEQLTTTENASIAGLRTFEPQTHARNNAGAEMTVDAYAGTANGKAVNELKQDVQSEISALKITQSGTLTLTTAGWDNNTQTVTYAHDTAKRNVIDVDPASVEEWASCGILATAETASGITFTCKTVPENALSFKVTSMGVN